MVRTYPVAPSQFDSARIAAWSAALALHALAFLLLLIPAAYQAAPLPRDPPQIRWITRDPPPPSPPRPPEVIEPRPLQTVQPRLVPPALPLPPATATAEDAPAVMLPAAEPTAALSVDAVAPPSSSGPAGELQYRSAPPPTYPVAALRAGQQGTVTLRVEVDAQGVPTAVSVEQSSGSRALDLAARQQVLKHWRFVPALRDGTAVPAVGRVPISFSLPQ